jgi:methionyl-tRNA formyltransferase
VDAAAAGGRLKVLLVAEEAVGARTLKALAERDVTIAGVLGGSEDETTGIGGLAAELGLPRLDPALVRDPGFGGWIVEQRVDLLLNVHSLHIVDATVLEAPAIGSFNLHPGPLPAYAGLNAPCWAIAAGETSHAVTLHWMTATVDAGPIAYEHRFGIGPRDTGLKVSTRCAEAGPELVERLLEDAAAGSIPALSQPTDVEGSWHGREVPHGGRLPWKLGARAVADLVRAADYAPFESPWGTFTTSVDGAQVEVLRASRSGEPSSAEAGLVGEPAERGVPISAGDEWVLIERVRIDGARAEPATALPVGAVCA